MTLRQLDGPAKQTTLTVTNSTVQELKADITSLVDRQVVTFRPDEEVYIYYGDGATTPSVSDLQTDGFLYFPEAVYTIEASVRQPLFILAVTTTANVKIVERG